MNINKVKEIIARYNRGGVSIEEKAKLDNWYAQESYKQMQNPETEDYERIKDELFASLAAYPGETVKVKSCRKAAVWGYRVAAAALITVLGVWVYVGKRDYSDATAYKINKENITPGEVGATLHLANGEKVKLTDLVKDERIEEAGITITKCASGQLIYENDNHDKVDYNKMNTLSTDRGQTYQVVLPDGSKVWLNAASSLTYTVGLIQGGERRVKLQGEAYFEISKDKNHPFVVESNKQRVTVLGTHFNVEAYTDQNCTKTTLLEGSVKISDAISNYSKSIMLTPGQQVTLSKEKIEVKNTDAEVAVAWTKGEFVFSDENLSEMMTKIGRWYDVDIVYQPGAPLQLQLNADLSRSYSLSEILNIIQSTGKVKFKIQNRKVLVFP